MLHNSSQILELQMVLKRLTEHICYETVTLYFDRKSKISTPITTLCYIKTIAKID